MRELGLIPRLPRLAVIQAEGAAPFYELMHSRDRTRLHAVEHPQTLATAIRIGDPVSWPKAVLEITASNGVVEKVTEQEIADAKATRRQLRTTIVALASVGETDRSKLKRFALHAARA